MSRRPDALRGRVARTTEVVAGDVLDANSLATALDGVEVAYYFVHSMGARSDFEHEDRKAASNFAAAAIFTLMAALFSQNHPKCNLFWVKT